MLLNMTTIKTDGFISNNDKYEPTGQDLKKSAIIVEKDQQRKVVTTTPEKMDPTKSFIYSRPITIEDLPKKYQKEVNKKILGMNTGINGVKGPNYDTIKQELIDEYYNKSQQEKKQEHKKQKTEVKIDLSNKSLKDIDSKIILKYASQLKEESNKKGEKQNEKQKELEKLKQEVEYLKKKDKEARMKAENLNLQIYSKKDKNGQSIADDDIRKQSNEAFDEWQKINKKYNDKNNKYNERLEEEEKKQKTEKKEKNQKSAKHGDKNINNEAQEFIKNQIKQNTEPQEKPIVKPCRRTAPFGDLGSYDHKIVNNTQARINSEKITEQLEASKKR